MSFAFGCQKRSADLVSFTVFKIGKNLLCPLNHPFRYPCYARHLDAVTSAGAPRNHFPEKNDLIIPFPDGYIKILHPRHGRSQFGQFMVVGGEKRSHTSRL